MSIGITVDDYESLIPVIRADVETGLIEDANSLAEELFGYNTVGDLYGMSVELLIPERFRELHKKLRLSCLRDDKPRLMGFRNHEFTGLTKDGQEFPCAISLCFKKSRVDMRKKALLAIMDLRSTDTTVRRGLN